MLSSRPLEEPPHPPQADVLYHPDSYRESYFRVIKCARTNVIFSAPEEPPYPPQADVLYQMSYFRVIKCARTNIILSLRGMRRFQEPPPDKSACSTILPIAIGTIGRATSSLN